MKFFYTYCAINTLKSISDPEFILSLSLSVIGMLVGVQYEGVNGLRE